MTFISSVALEVDDPTAAEAFYAAAFDLGPRLTLRPSQSPTTGFRGFTLSLVVSQPATVDDLVNAAADAGATPLKPVKKSFWGYGGVVRAPDGTIWKVATSSKKNTGPATRQIDEMVLLLGVADVAASKHFLVDHGLEVAKSFGRKYVQFAGQDITLALYGRRALAKDAGVSPDGAGSHRIIICGDAAAFTDPDGFAWEADRPQDGTAKVATGSPIPQAARPHQRTLPITPRLQEVPMSPKANTQKRAKRTTATNKSSSGFTAEERAAMKERVRELKSERGGTADGESEVLAKIAAMGDSDRALAERFHATVTATAPELVPRTWYGMPAYAKDGKVICYFRDARKFKERYATFGFNDKAKLDDGAMWPIGFALKELTSDVEARISVLVKRAVS